MPPPLPRKCAHFFPERTPPPSSPAATSAHHLGRSKPPLAALRSRAAWLWLLPSRPRLASSPRSSCLARLALLASPRFPRISRLASPASHCPPRIARIASPASYRLPRVACLASPASCHLPRFACLTSLHRLPCLACLASPAVASLPFACVLASLSRLASPPVLPRLLALLHALVFFNTLVCWCSPRLAASLTSPPRPATCSGVFQHPLMLVLSHSHMYIQRACARAPLYPEGIDP